MSGLFVRSVWFNVSGSRIPPPSFRPGDAVVLNGFSSITLWNEHVQEGFDDYSSAGHIADQDECTVVCTLVGIDVDTDDLFLIVNGKCPFVGWSYARFFRASR